MAPEVARLLHAAEGPPWAQPGRSDLMKTQPWYSLLQNVHHDNTHCPEGKQIEKQHRCQGTGGRPLCQGCAKLGGAGVKPPARR